MGDGEVSKKRWSIRDYIEKMTPEQYEQWREESRQKKIAAAAKKREAIEQAKAKAEQMLPEILAQDLLLLDSDAYTPRPEVIIKLKDLIESGLSIEQMRRKHFSSMSEKGWDRLTKYLFKNHVANKEHLGNELISAYQGELIRLDKHIKTIEKEIRITRKHNKEKYGHKKTSATLLELLGAALKDRREYEIAMKKTLASVAMDNGKNKTNTAIHIHTAVPRPKADEGVVKDITPTKLTDLLG